VAQQAEQPRTRQSLGARARGVSAARAWRRRWPRSLHSSLYRGLVAVGGRPGNFAVLARLADYLEARQALKQKVRLALIYPVLWR
jgi:general secretion pathway protein F